MPDLGMVVHAGLMVAGLAWCYVVLKRWRDDVQTVRSGPAGFRVAVIVWWAVTVVVGAVTIASIWRVVSRIIAGIISLM